MLRRVTSALPGRARRLRLSPWRAAAVVAGALWLAVQVVTWPAGFQPAAAFADTVVADGSDLVAGQATAPSSLYPTTLTNGLSAAPSSLFQQAPAFSYTTGAAGDAARIAIAFARAQLGLPYQWGGDGPAHNDAGFDCSGLTHAAYAAAGIELPRTADTQYNAGPHVAPWIPLAPGDLVFYGTPAHVHHVGLYIGNNQMINAPTFGQPVQIAFYRWVGDDYVGATRPAATPGHLVSALDPHPPALPPTPPAPGPGPWPTPGPTPTPSPTPSGSSSGSPSPSPSPSASPTPSPAPSCPSPTPTPSTSPSPSPSPSASGSPTPSPAPSCPPVGVSPSPTPVPVTSSAAAVPDPVPSSPAAVPAPIPAPVSSPVADPVPSPSPSAA